ncbi:hypothetical protein [Aquipuribacter sp. SD81]|uniref:hypothetical protein n=1 Tax=Aquipuribacter sp. SD81 TaxID=3127703 RepID=UPI003016D552
MSAAPPATTSDAPSPAPAPSSAPPSEAPSLSPAEAAAADAEAAYRAWLDWQNQSLQAPLPFTEESSDEEFEAFTEATRQYGFDEAEGRLVSAVIEYDNRDWSQVGTIDVISLSPTETVLDPEEGRPFVTLEVCWTQSADFSIVLSDGSVAEQFAQDQSDENFGGSVRVEKLDEDPFDGWYVQSVADDPEVQC